MKNRIVALLAGISIVALLAAGCANKEAVKKEEAMVPDASVAKVEPAKPVEEPKAVEQAKAVEEPEAVEQAKAALSEAAVTAAPQTANTADNRFETVYFDFDKSDLRQDARDVLSKNAEVILKSFAGAKIQIEGHCYERGSAEYNLALGEHRAKSAQKYLTTLGVKSENLSVISYGKEKPAVNATDEAGWAKNRRAEFVVVK